MLTFYQYSKYMHYNSIIHIISLAVIGTDCLDNYNTITTTTVHVSDCEKDGRQQYEKKRLKKRNNDK
jgi:hypothetical protein